MIRHLQWLVVLLWGAASWGLHPTTAVGQDLLVANNTTSSNESILRFSSGGDFLGDFARTSPRGGPVGLAFDNNGDLYVANHGNNSIHRYANTGTDLGVFARTGLNLPTGVAFDSKGQLVVCNYGDGSLSFYSATGKLLSQVWTGLLNPIALAVDSHDNIYISTPSIGANSGVFRFAPNGAQQTMLVPGAWLDARGLAFDSAGHLYVADQFGQVVQRFTSEGAFLGTFASAGLKDPFALAFDASGDLYVSNQSGGIIRRYSPSGEDLGAFAVMPAGLANHVGLAFLPVPEPTQLLLLLIAVTIRLFSSQRSQIKPDPAVLRPAN